MAGFAFESYLADLVRLVNAESKTGEIAALTDCSYVLLDIGNRILGPRAQARVIETAEGPVIQWRIGMPPYRLGLVGHYDTVHPLGTIAGFPYSQEGDVVRGPGTFDMKAGLLTILYGVAAAAQYGPVDGVLIHCCPDEEEGSRASQESLRQAVDDGLSVALVYEGAGPGGSVYTQRKGGLWLEAVFAGRDAHASRAHEGANALTAMSEYVLRLDQVASPSEATTVVATMASSGTGINTAPGSASLIVDCRAETSSEQDRVLKELAELPVSTAGVHYRLETLSRISPFDVGSSASLFVALTAACREAGLPEPAATIGQGVSDANHLAGMGVLVLDGLGPEGGQDHSPEEWISVSSIPGRVDLTARTLPALTAFSATTAATLTTSLTTALTTDEGQILTS